MAKNINFTIFMALMVVILGVSIVTASNTLMSSKKTLTYDFTDSEFGMDVNLGHALGTINSWATYNYTGDGLEVTSNGSSLNINLGDTTDEILAMVDASTSINNMEIYFHDLDFNNNLENEVMNFSEVKDFKVKFRIGVNATINSNSIYLGFGDDITSVSQDHEYTYSELIFGVYAFNLNTMADFGSWYDWYYNSNSEGSSYYDYTLDFDLENGYVVMTVEDDKNNKEVFFDYLSGDMVSVDYAENVNLNDFDMRISAYYFPENYAQYDGTATGGEYFIENLQVEFQ